VLSDKVSEVLDKVFFFKEFRKCSFTNPLVTIECVISIAWKIPFPEEAFKCFF